jgi:hypothetical protein
MIEWVAKDIDIHEIYWSDWCLGALIRTPTNWKFDGLGKIVVVSGSDTPIEAVKEFTIRWLTIELFTIGKSLEFK